MKLFIGLLVVVTLFLGIRHLLSRSTFLRFHDDPPPPLDLKNLGENPKPERTSRPKQKDT
jgi:hypothetical protein